MKKNSGITVKQADLRDIDILVEQRHRMFEDIRHRTRDAHRAADGAYKKWMIAMI